MVHGAGADLAERRGAEHDPRRRRRRHPASCTRARSTRRPARSPARPRTTTRSGVVILDQLRDSLAGRARQVDQGRRDDQGRHRGDHDRRAPSLRDGQGRRAQVPGDQRQRLGDQVQVRQQVRLPPLPDRRHQPGHRRAHRRQGRAGLRLRRRGQGLRGVAARPGRPGDRHRDRPDLRAAGGHGRLPGHHARRRRRPGRHLRHHDRQQGHHHRRRHGEDEAPGHRRQHRPLRQRDRHGRAWRRSPVSSGSTSSRRSTSGSSPTATRSSCCPRAACSTWATRPATRPS